MYRYTIKTISVHVSRKSKGTCVEKVTGGLKERGREEYTQGLGHTPGDPPTLRQCHSAIHQRFVSVTLRSTNASSVSRDGERERERARERERGREKPALPEKERERERQR